MLTVKKLKLIKELIEYSDMSGTDGIDELEKTIDNEIKKAEKENRYLWSFYWDCGRMGSVEGVFKATKETVENAIGKTVYFGEILGKCSEIEGELEKGDIELVSTDPVYVSSATVSGYNPLDYIYED